MQTKFTQCLNKIEFGWDKLQMIRGVEEISWDRDLPCKIGFFIDGSRNHHPTAPEGEDKFGFLYLRIPYKKVGEGRNFLQYFWVAL